MSFIDEFQEEIKYEVADESLEASKEVSMGLTSVILGSKSLFCRRKPRPVSAAVVC
jgi:hypothetical protein